MGIMAPITWTPFRDVLTIHLRDRKPKIATGGTKKESERLAATFLAERECRFGELARIATAERIRLMAPLYAVSDEERQWVDVVGSWEAQRWLNALEKEWDAGRWTDVADDEFFAEVEHTFNEAVVLGDDFGLRLQGFRRDLILAGKLEPEERDMGWLMKERENFAAVVNPYDRALAKLQTPAGTGG